MSDSANTPACIEEHVKNSWEFFQRIGSPKYHVAPMVDQSELPFRMLCRKLGSTCAYTPMIHSRLFVEDKSYRKEIFTTCAEDRPLLVQFCANSPDFLTQAAKLVEDQCDAVDLNLGCPQRIAKRGYYGSFLMDNLPLVEQLVSTLSKSLSVPVTCKIRIFPSLDDTLSYAKMLEAAGCSLLAVHGRTREQKDTSKFMADWDQIRAVKAALRIPILANGNIRCLQEAHDCMAYTGADGVLSAEPLLEDPALFLPPPERPLEDKWWRERAAPARAVEYLRLCQQYSVPLRMVKGHLHKMCGGWLAEHIDLRDRLNKEITMGLEGLIDLMEEMGERVKANGRDYPVPTLTPRQRANLEREEAKKAAIEEQEREAQALAALDAPAEGTDGRSEVQPGSNSQVAQGTGCGAECLGEGEGVAVAQEGHQGPLCSVRVSSS